MDAICAGSKVLLDLPPSLLIDVAGRVGSLVAHDGVVLGFGTAGGRGAQGGTIGWRWRGHAGPCVPTVPAPIKPSANHRLPGGYPRENDGFVTSVTIGLIGLETADRRSIDRFTGYRRLTEGMVTSG